jgi:hypothetical protein
MAAEIIQYSRTDEMPQFGTAILEPGAGWFLTDHTNKLVELLFVLCFDTETVKIMRGEIELPKYEGGMVVVNEEVVANALDLEGDSDEVKVGERHKIDFIDDAGMKRTVLVKNLGNFQSDFRPN